MSAGGGRRRWRPAYIGIGSNLDDPTAQVRSALQSLAELPASRLVAASRLFRSPPMGPRDQPDYVNAAAAVLTRLEPHALLDELQAVEAAHGRDRSGERWGPRTLDLDLLVLGAETVADERLRVPHPGIAERNFVLLPLMDIAPELRVPGAGSVARLAAALPPGARSLDVLGPAGQ